METAAVYSSVIERTIEKITGSVEASSVRNDVVDTIRRKWVSALENTQNTNPNATKSSADSNPSSVTRSKYRIKIDSPTAPIPTKPEPVTEVVEEDDFSDEFDDAEFVHATEVGRKLAESTNVPARPACTTPPPATKQLVVAVKDMVNVEALDDSLDDPDYDQIIEPHECQVRVFGQTEVCESIQGPRRSGSRWMVTVLNGFVKTKNDEEYLFRTANQTMPHFHQHF